MSHSLVQQLKDDLSSGQRSRKKEAIKSIKQFKDGLPKHLSTEDKVAVVLKLLVLNTKELIPVWQSLLLCKEESITAEVRKQIDQLLSIDERFDFIESLVGDANHHEQALELVAMWSSTSYGDLVISFLRSDDDDLVIKAVKVLSEINFVAYVNKFIPLIHHPNDEIRLCVAETIASAKNEKVPFYFYEKCLFDDVRQVRQAALSGGVNHPDKEWIRPLKRFIKEYDEVDDLEKAIRILGVINHKRVIPPILDCLNHTQNQSMRWACIQALDEVDLNLRLAYFDKHLSHSEPHDWPQTIELLGHCEGEKTYLILRKLLRQTKEPGLRSLIIGAMGTCAYPDAEQDLVEMMESGLAETYAAAAALKNLVKDKVLTYFETFLRKEDLDEVVKQVIIQHIGESANSMDIPSSLRELVESNFKSKNENMRYISLIAIGHIASVKSINALLKIAKTKWVKRFIQDYDMTMEKCCCGKISPLLEKMKKFGQDHEAFEIICDFLKRHPMRLSEDDLNTLNDSGVFSRWAWDEELLGCIKRTHEYDKSFVWRQFSRDNLPEKLCCFIASGFDAANPYAREIVDTSILIQCFGRYQNEKPLLLLGRLMSNFPRVELLPSLIKFAESASEETAPIFKYYVRRIVEALNEN